MKRPLLTAFALFFLCLAALPAFAAQSPAREKVLLDSDMVECFDDGIAMLLLAKAPNVELVGVTTLTGNSWMEDGTAYALRQLEDAGIRDVPVVPGLSMPLRPNRHALFTLERQLIGRGHDYWTGSFGLPRPASWQAAYEKAYGEKPKLKPVDKHAVNFIIDTVRANPGQITIAAIGPCGNLALAVRMAPDIVPLIKRVIYMGGAFFQPGNTTPAAEFNWYFDPEAARIVVRSPFKEQIVFGLDVCERILFKRQHYDKLRTTLGDSPLGAMLRKTFVGQTFEKNPDFIHFVWDVLVAAYIIDPTLATDIVEQWIDVNDQPGPSYGQSLAYPVQAPMGAQKAKIVRALDADRFWNMLNEALSEKGEKK